MRDPYKTRGQLKDWSKTNRQSKSIVVVGLGIEKEFEIPTNEAEFEDEIWYTTVTVCKFIEKE